jgi:hypothetical protein
MDERGRRAGLMEEPVPRLVVHAHLDRDGAAEREVFGQKDLAHSALPEPPFDAVVRDALADPWIVRISPTGDRAGYRGRSSKVPMACEAPGSVEILPVRAWPSQRPT